MLSSDKAVGAASLLLAMACAFASPRPVELTIRGQVIDSSNGNPIPGAIVDISEFNSPGKSGAPIGSYEQVATTVADAQGRFEVKVIARRTIGYGTRICGIPTPAANLIRRDDYERKLVIDVSIKANMSACASNVSR